MEKNKEKKKIDFRRVGLNALLFLIVAGVVVYAGIVITDDEITMGDANMTGGNLLNYTIITDSVATLTAGAWTGLVSVTATTFSDGTASLSGGVLTDADLSGSVMANGEDTVLYLSFNENISSTAYDSSIESNDGTITNAVWTSDGRFSSALSFDGDDDYVDCGNDASLIQNETITIMAWVSPVSLTDQGDIVAHYKTVGDDRVFEFQVSNDDLVFSISEDGGFTNINVVTSTDTISLGWNHIVAVWNGTTMYQYVNGVLDSATTDNTLMHYGTNNVRIGSYESGRYFNGTIDEVKIYDRAVTDAEVRSAYISGISSHSPDGHLLERDIPYGTKLRFYNTTGDIDGCMFHNSTDILLTSNVSLC